MAWITGVAGRYKDIDFRCLQPGKLSGEPIVRGDEVNLSDPRHGTLQETRRVSGIRDFVLPTVCSHREGSYNVVLVPC